ncbi:MAG: TRAP transporter substrate-binding protein [Bacillota bacterium]
MVRALRVSAAVSLIMLTLSLTAVAGSPSTIVMRVAHCMPTTHGYQIWIDKFAEELKARVGDRVEVKAFPNAQLGTETEYLEGMKLGTLDAAVLGRHGQVDTRLEVLNLPFIFRDVAHTDKVLRSGGELEQLFNKILLEHGYVCLGWGELGFRHVTANKPVRSVADLKGLDIRIPNTPALLSAFKKWGANPTPLDFGELYTALQQGVVKAQENPPEIIYTNKFYEVQKYMSLTAHANLACQFLVSRRYWDTLPRDIQDAMIEAALIGRDYHLRMVRKANDELIAKLEKAGMIVIRDVDRGSFLPGAREVHAEFASKIGADLIQKVAEAGK